MWDKSIINNNVKLIAKFPCYLLSIIRVNNVRNVSLNKEIQHNVTFKTFRGVESTKKIQTTIRNVENVLN